ncbi:AAA family ATPase [Actinoplanes sp. NPDC048988]|uniref:AAA family ATPase n=1 Tax=Actinoplanes sp. NPDC048988 TaxID=3363901 RepID=UPI003714AC86
MTVDPKEIRPPLLNPVAGSGGIAATAPAPAVFATLVGREKECRRLRDAAAALAGHTGRSIRVQGTAGMGKSAFLSAALRDVVPAGGRVGWAAGSELAQRIPFRVLLECLETALPDDNRCEALRRLSDEVTDGATLAGAAGRAAGLIRGAAADGPLILVADDLQWADAGTVRVWDLLRDSTREMPLLLIGATRPGEAQPPGADEVIELTPLPAAHASQLVRTVMGREPDRRLIREIVVEAAGNPCYLRLLAAKGSVRITPELTFAIAGHLEHYAGATRRALNAVAHLVAGDESVDVAGCERGDLAVVTGRGSEDLLRDLAPAVRGGVLTVSGERIEFRCRIVARVLHEEGSAPLRVMVHRSFASRLADANRPPERVVGQLLAGPVPMRGPIVGWLTDHVESLFERTPHLALSTLEQARSQDGIAFADRLVITAWLARLRQRQNRDCVAEADWVAAHTDDPLLRGEMRWLAALAHERNGNHLRAAGIAWAELRDGGAPASRQSGFRSLLDRMSPHLPSTARPSLPRSVTTGHDTAVNW